MRSKECWCDVAARPWPMKTNDISSTCRRIVGGSEGNRWTFARSGTGLFVHATNTRNVAHRSRSSWSVFPSQRDRPSISWTTLLILRKRDDSLEMHQRNKIPDERVVLDCAGLIVSQTTNANWRLGHFVAPFHLLPVCIWWICYHGHHLVNWTNVQIKLLVGVRKMRPTCEISVSRLVHRIDLYLVPIESSLSDLTKWKVSMW